jgi:hypothetical protein
VLPNVQLFKTSGRIVSMNLEHLFEPRHPNGLSWPDIGVYLAESKKLLFCPIAKCGSTSLKRLMVELSDVPHKQEILSGDVHRATGVFRTGALLIDLDPDHARQIIQDPDFFRFSVVRDPFDRLLSAFREKFVVNRLQPPNHWHTCEVLTNVQGQDQPDYDEGISFAEFIDFITTQPPEKLDTHWRPQSHYLRTMRYDRLYAFEDFGTLESDLELRIGQSLKIQHRNRSIGVEQREVLGITRQRAGTIEAIAEVSKRSFMEDPELLDKVEAYYAEDRRQYCDALEVTRRSPVR